MKKFYQWLLHKNKPGTNLIELLIVFAILALLTAIIVPSISFLKQQAIANELDRLQTICIFLQKQAIYTGKKKILTFNANEGTYFYNQQRIELADNVMFGVMDGVMGPPANPEGPITSPISFPNQKIIFYPNGTISAGTAYLTNRQKTAVYALTIAVSQVAFIRKYRYQNQQWVYLKS